MAIKIWIPTVGLMLAIETGYREGRGQVRAVHLAIETRTKLVLSDSGSSSQNGGN